MASEIWTLWNLTSEAYKKYKMTTINLHDELKSVCNTIKLEKNNAKSGE